MHRRRRVMTGVAVAVLGAGFVVAGAGPAAQAVSTACPWVGSSAPISQRVSEVLARMSLTQKVDLLTGAAAPATSASSPPSGRCASRRSTWRTAPPESATG